jgi:hypothetical protein
MVLVLSIIPEIQDAQILASERTSFLALQPTQTSSKDGFSCFARNKQDQF